jgi:hypothetical protein
LTFSSNIFTPGKENIAEYPGKNKRLRDNPLWRPLDKRLDKPLNAAGSRKAAAKPRRRRPVTAPFPAEFEELSNFREIPNRNGLIGLIFVNLYIKFLVT